MVQWSSAQGRARRARPAEAAGTTARGIVIHMIVSIATVSDPIP